MIEIQIQIQIEFYLDYPRLLGFTVAILQKFAWVQQEAFLKDSRMRIIHTLPNQEGRFANRCNMLRLIRLSQDVACCSVSNT